MNEYVLTADTRRVYLKMKKFCAAIIKLLPIAVLIALLLSGIDVLLASAIAMFAAVFICMLFQKTGINETIAIAYEEAKNGVGVAFILMMAYAMAEVFMRTGVSASAITIMIRVGVTGRTVALVGFFTACLLSVASGTSMGTFAACFPIFIWMSHVAGGNEALTVAAIVGGSGFGDNIGLISDTTILSSGLQEVSVYDRVKSQLWWTIGCAVLAAICFFLAGVWMHLPNTVASVATVIEDLPVEAITSLEAERPSVLALLAQVQAGVKTYMILPVAVVIVLAIIHIDTSVCLGAGIVSAWLLGIPAGTVQATMEVCDAVLDGFSDAGSWGVIMLFWAMGFGALMRKIDAFHPLVVFFTAICKKVRHLSVCNGLLSLLMNIFLADDLAQIAVTSPITKNLIEENVIGSEEDKYALRVRNALFADAVGVHTAAMIPWHLVGAFYFSVANGVYPLCHFSAINMKWNFMGIITVFSLFLMTYTGLDRLIPGFGLPKEPTVRVKKALSQDDSPVQTIKM